MLLWICYPGIQPVVSPLVLNNYVSLVLLQVSCPELAGVVFRFFIPGLGGAIIAACFARIVL